MKNRSAELTHETRLNTIKTFSLAVSISFLVRVLVTREIEPGAQNCYAAVLKQFQNLTFPQEHTDEHHQPCMSDELKSTFEKFLASLSPDFCQKGLEMLPEKWKKCVDSVGDYFD
ncbi:hypothetical protein RvY_10907 [Ramazzottius varieornatus]|uniref:Uncharacterized protein n=1 Tax=Ramazzottius varieornatus TaxID=947166 RepID=A0A1D1VN93_RAMVA|nr:hypothetical protein RvY_10907 [Ramazzottius varieornatus]